MRQTIPVLLLTAGIAAAAEIHVAPNGNDANPGTADKPFATLERGRDALRGHGGGDVVVHGGVYVLQQTLELTPADSGAAHKPFRYVAAKNETPIITSAREITGWRTHDANIFVADVQPGWRFHNLYVKGQPQQIARTPNTDVKGWRNWPRLQGNAKFTPDGMQDTVPAGLAKGMPGNGDVEVNFIPVMFWNSLPVLKKVEGDTVTLASRNPTTWEFGGRNYQDGCIQFHNALVCLDQPGEWCVDSAAGKVYFWPPDGTMDGKTVTAPTLYELVRMQGDDLAARSNDWRVKFDAAGKPINAPALPASSAAAFDRLVRHVEFVGLTFECTDRMPEDQWPKDWLKRNAENPDGALFLQGVEECAIRDCTFRNCGAYAVVLDHYAQRVSVIRNEMHTLGCGGVQATGYGPGALDVNGHHVIRRNYIHSTGRDYMHSAAVTIFGSRHNDFSLNWIADCPYAAVQICGTNPDVINDPDNPNNGPSMDLYGDRTAQHQLRRHELPPTTDYEGVKRFLHSGGNWVCRNVVDEFMTTLGDGGALYCWSVDHDNVWFENLLKSSRQHHNVYMDDWTGRAVVEGTIAWSPCDWCDNSHNPTPDAHRAPPGISATGKTVIQWRNNVGSYPGKPDGFDERLGLIGDDAATEGGWPKTLTDELQDALTGNAKREPAPLAAGAWVGAKDARRLNGPRYPDARRETIGWCEGGGSIAFGPYRFTPGTITGMEVEVGVDPTLAGGKMHVRLDAADGPSIGTFTFQDTGGFESFKPQRVAVKEPAGDHLLFFVFEGGGGICNLRQFRFTK